MDFSLNKDASFLNANEASVVETVVRAAVVSILKVFCEVNEKRSRCYELKLAEAERQNAALNIQLQAAERELQTLRHICSNDNTSAETTLIHDFSSEFPEEPREEPVCFRGGSESDSVPVLKEEEAFYPNKLFIKSEQTEEYSIVNFEYPAVENAPICQRTAQMNTYGPQHSHTHAINPDTVLTESERRRMTRYENVRRYRAKIRADPVKYLAWKEKNRLRYLQNRKPINELPEPMKNQQRKAWREATRRHRAKKLAQGTVSATSVYLTPSL